MTTSSFAAGAYANIHHNLVHAVRGSDVSLTMVAGHVLVEDGLDLKRLGQVREVERGRCRKLLVDDLVAEIDALVADVDARTCDQLLDLPLGLAAEAAEELLA